MNNFAIIIISLFSLSTFASGIPNEVRENVFKVIPINTYAAVIPEKLARSRYQEQCAYKQHTLTIDKRMNCEVLRVCKEDQCLEQFQATGTGFLLEGGRTLMTAMHVMYSVHNLPLTMFHKTLEERGGEEKRKALNNLRPEFLLVNDEGETIFDSRKQLQETLYEFWGDPLAISFQLSGSKLGEAFGFFGNAPYDYVGIKLPHSLGRGLRIANKVSKADLNVFSGYGYPYQVEEQGKLKHSPLKANSIKNLYKKATHFLEYQKVMPTLSDEELLAKPMDEILYIMGYDDESVKAQLDYYEESVLYSSVKTVLHDQKRVLKDLELDKHNNVIAFDGNIMIGQSGGPILNHNNEVIGVITNNLFNQYNGGVGVLINNETPSKPDMFMTK